MPDWCLHLVLQSASDKKEPVSVVFDLCTSTIHKRANDEQIMPMYDLKAI